MMPLVIPTVALSIAGASLCADVSVTGKRTRRHICELRSSYEDTVTFGLSRESVLGDLAELRRSHSTPNWDGYDARPIDPASYFYAKAFLQSYPLGLPLPELSLDPDGEVSMDWGNSSENVFSVSVSPQGRLSFAGLFGDESVKGAEFFSGEIPAKIVEGIQRVGAGI